MSTNPFIPGIAELVYFDPFGGVGAEVTPATPKAAADAGTKPAEGAAVTQFTHGKSVPGSLWL